MKLAFSLVGLTLGSLAALAQPVDTLWTKMYGGPYWEGAYSMRRTSDGGFILAGDLQNIGTYRVIYVVKTDSLGDTLWTRRYHREGGEALAWTVKQVPVPANGYVLAGYVRGGSNGPKQMSVLKIDNLGDEEWWHDFGGSGDEEAGDIQVCADGGYILAGYTTSYGEGEADFYAVKLSPVGDEQWSHTYGWIHWDQSHSICETLDGGYALAGKTGGGTAGYVVRIDSAGEQMWTHLYGWPNGGEEIRAIKQTPDGDFVLAGYSTVHDGTFGDIMLVKTDSLGDTLWTRLYSEDEAGYATSLDLTDDGGYIIGGFTQYSQFYILKTNQFGDVVWAHNVSHGSRAWSVVGLSGGRCAAAGYREVPGGNGQTDMYLVMIGPNLSAPETTSPCIPATAHLTAFPNPFNLATEIQLNLPRQSRVVVAVHDLLGRHVATLHEGMLEPGEHRFTFDGSILPSGIYFARVQAGEFVKTQKLLLLK